MRHGFYTILLAAVLAALAIPGLAQAQPLPAYYSGPPAGHYLGQQPKGLMLTIHGGGWVSTGPTYMAMQPTALYQNAGWGVWNVDYRPGALSIVDVVRLYDKARKVVGPDVPICATGQSAGGHLAMLLAAYRPKLACAISEEGPIDLQPLRRKDGTFRKFRRVVRKVFTEADARRLSPSERLGNYHGRILASFSPADITIQAGPQLAAVERMKQTSPARVAVRIVPGSGGKGGRFARVGDVRWVHFFARAAALKRWQETQRAFLRTVAGP